MTSARTKETIANLKQSAKKALLMMIILAVIATIIGLTIYKYTASPEADQKFIENLT